MKLTSDNETLAENKVLILYVLNTINKPIGNSELLELILSITDMNYFYFQQFLLDLLENKYITKYKEEDSAETLYEITPLGKNTLELTKELIPGIIKLKIDNTVKGEFEEIQEKLSITSEFIPKSENEFTVKCKIVENGKIVFEVSSFAASREQAKFIADNWKNNAVNIYPKIMDLLIK